MYLQEEDESDVGNVCCCSMPKPFDYDHDLIPPEPNFFNAGFLMDKEDRYLFCKQTAE